MTSRRLLSLCLALTGLLVFLPAAAQAATKQKVPTITKVSPMRVDVGDKLTIRGKNFKKRAKSNTVIFRSSSGRTALAKPIQASTKKLVVRVPAGVAKILSTKPARFKIRVLAGKFSKYTSPRLSPVIVPDNVGGNGGGGNGGSGGNGGVGGDGTPVPASCPSSNGSADDDSDLLTNSLEVQLGTNRCNADSDGDGVQDGFEYKSAVDLNDDQFQAPDSSIPYPGQAPYPNPLNQDAGVDYDGDSLTLLEEQELWKFTITNGATRTLFPLTYSDGEQYSEMTKNGAGHRVPTLSATNYSKQVSFLNWATSAGYRNVALDDGPPWSGSITPNTYGLLDFNRQDGEGPSAPPSYAGAGYHYSEPHYFDYDQDGFLSDDERDEDADGLTNFDEQHGRLRPNYWAACYPAETAYGVQYAGTGMVDADSDNDGVLDGADDQDHDDIPNLMEMSRNAASGYDETDGASCSPRTGLNSNGEHPSAYGRVNPFNPCLPAYWSRTCQRHPGFGGSAAPFDTSPNWYSLN